jgi:hypothetical protein
MPYITPAEKMKLFGVIERIPDNLTPGQLNYVITRILVKQLVPESGYTKFNELLGVMEAAKQEFYRRVVVPYEDKKLEKNGDVYNYERIAITQEPPFA